jgi:hypothetical protein
MQTDLHNEFSMWSHPKRLQVLTLLFTTSASCKDYWKFQVEGNVGAIPGLEILEKVLRDIAEKGKKLTTEEEGMEVVGRIHDMVTKKIWRPKPKSSHISAAQQQLASGLPALTLASSAQDETAALGSSQRRAYPTDEFSAGPQKKTRLNKDDPGLIWFPGRGDTDLKPTTPKTGPNNTAAQISRQDFYFAVLDQRHTGYFFGDNVQLLIRAIKHWKGEELVNRDDKLTTPDQETKARLAPHTVEKTLKPLCRMFSIKLSKLSKAQMVDELAKYPTVLEELDKLHSQHVDGEVDGDSDITMPDSAEEIAARTKSLALGASSDSSDL